MANSIPSTPAPQVTIAPPPARKTNVQTQPPVKLEPAPPASATTGTKVNKAV